MNIIKHNLSPKDYDKYIFAMDNKPMHGFTINLLKLLHSTIDLEFVREKFDAKIVFKNDNFAYMIYDKEKLEKKGVFPGKDPLYHAGLYYIQEPSASKVLQEIKFDKDDVVLDMCASPGGKTIEALHSLDKEKGGFIISNEIIGDRARVLSSNIERMGFDNSIVTCNDTETLINYFNQYFDKIILDAPCSGEGMFRKSADARNQWSMSLVKSCASLQKELIDNAVLMLKDGGILIYSTCTFSKEEDEDNAKYIINKYPFMKILKEEKIYPYMGFGEGQYYAIFKKEGEINCKTKPPTLKDLKGLNVLRYGLNLYDDHNGRKEPTHASTHNEKVEFDNIVELTDEEIDRYLKGDVIRKGNLKNGWCKITYKGIGVGLGKVTNGCIKNHYPKGLRIF